MKEVTTLLATLVATASFSSRPPTNKIICTNTDSKTLINKNILSLALLGVFSLYKLAN